jgi:hypothetical protein
LQALLSIGPRPYVEHMKPEMPDFGLIGSGSEKRIGFEQLWPHFLDIPNNPLLEIPRHLPRLDGTKLCQNFHAAFHGSFYTRLGF